MKNIIFYSNNNPPPPYEKDTLFIPVSLDEYNYIVQSAEYCDRFIKRCIYEAFDEAATQVINEMYDERHNKQT